MPITAWSLFNDSFTLSRRKTSELLKRANNNNPIIPPKQQKTRDFIRHHIRPIHFSASVGMNYKLTDRLKGTGMINFRTTQTGKFFNTINVGFGVQYDLRHKK